MKKIVLLTAILFPLVSASLKAKIEMPSVFSDNMVLQQNEQVAFWGKASGKKVTIKASWEKKKTVVIPDADGKWFTRIQTPQAGGPFEITISDGEKMVLHNVLVGEVWFCGGQSNMEMPMRGWAGQPVEHSTDYIMRAKPSVPIRICNIPKRNSVKPLEWSEGSWQENTPETVASSSAVAYFFACKLYEILDIPIGIISDNWGGSSIETWIPREAFEKELPGEFDLSFLDKGEVDKKNHKSPCILYNGMVAPLVPFTFKGIIWYQGEANRTRAEQYTRLQPLYVKKMREVFNNPKAPFYFVQIAPYRYGGSAKAFTFGYFNEAQQKTLALIPHSGMVPTVDLGCELFIHPPKKMEVGNRLAYHALVENYGLKGIKPDAPSYTSVEFKDSVAVVKVNITDPGLLPAKVPVGGFEIAGEDRVFHPATAVAYKDVITVSSDEVCAPVAVRYCFRNWSVGTLFNSVGIPLPPFRTDSWNDLKE